MPLADALRVNVSLRRVDVSNNASKSKKVFKSAFDANMWLSELKYGPKAGDKWVKKVIYDPRLAQMTHDIKDLVALDHARVNLTSMGLNNVDGGLLKPIFDDHSKKKQEKKGLSKTAKKEGALFLCFVEEIFACHPHSRFPAQTSWPSTSLCSPRTPSSRSRAASARWARCDGSC